jgi:cell division control protein 7
MRKSQCFDEFSPGRQPPTLRSVQKTRRSLNLSARRTEDEKTPQTLRKADPARNMRSPVSNSAGGVTTGHNSRKRARSASEDMASRIPKCKPTAIHRNASGAKPLTARETEERGALLRKRVCKEFFKESGESYGFFTGHVHTWAGATDTFRIEYDDGDDEVLTYDETKLLVLGSKRFQWHQALHSVSASCPVVSAGSDGNDTTRRTPRSATSKRQSCSLVHSLSPDAIVTTKTVDVAESKPSDVGMTPAKDPAGNAKRAQKTASSARHGKGMHIRAAGRACELAGDHTKRHNVTGKMGGGSAREEHAQGSESGKQPAQLASACNEAGLNKLRDRKSNGRAVASSAWPGKGGGRRGESVRASKEPRSQRNASAASPSIAGCSPEKAPASSPSARRLFTGTPAMPRLHMSSELSAGSTAVAETEPTLPPNKGEALACQMRLNVLNRSPTPMLPRGRSSRPHASPARAKAESAGVSACEAMGSGCSGPCAVAFQSQQCQNSCQSQPSQNTALGAQERRVSPRKGLAQHSASPSKGPADAAHGLVVAVAAPPVDKACARTAAHPVPLTVAVDTSVELASREGKGAAEASMRSPTRGTSAPRDRATGAKSQTAGVDAHVQPDTGSASAPVGKQSPLQPEQPSLVCSVSAGVRQTMSPRDSRAAARERDKAPDHPDQCEKMSCEGVGEGGGGGTRGGGGGKASCVGQRAGKDSPYSEITASTTSQVRKRFRDEGSSIGPSFRAPEGKRVDRGDSYRPRREEGMGGGKVVGGGSGADKDEEEAHGHGRNGKGASRVTEEQKERPRDRSKEGRGDEKPRAIPAELIKYENDRRFLEHVHQQFDIVRLIGSGTYGEVYECWDRFNARRVAIKRLIPGINNSKGCKSYVEEASIIKLLTGCPNVVNVVPSAPLAPDGHMCLEDESAIVLTYLDHDSPKLLAKELSVDQNAIREYMRELLVALEHVHAAGLIHNDIKLSNVLYKRSSKQCLLVDFGLACHTHAGSSDHSSGMRMPRAREHSKEHTRARVLPRHRLLHQRQHSKPAALAAVKTLAHEPRRHGTKGFRAPEVVLGSPLQTSAVDLWSAGVVMLCLLTGAQQFAWLSHDTGIRLRVREAVL